VSGRGDIIQPINLYGLAMDCQRWELFEGAKFELVPASMREEVQAGRVEFSKELG
jgi:hypothetical protein